jgi:hypothetical protein
MILQDVLLEKIDLRGYLIMHALRNISACQASLIIGQASHRQSLVV